MSFILRKIREIFSVNPASGGASPPGYTVSDTAEIPLRDVWELYKRDPACKSSVDLLAASVKKRFYTTCAPEKDYADAEKAKADVDVFNKTVNLDGLLWQMSKRLVACGNDFWLKPSATEVIRLPIDAVEKIEVEFIEQEGIKVPLRESGFKLRAKYGGGTLKPDVVIHWSLDTDGSCGFGVGLLQVLLHTLTINTDKRPSYAWMKAKIETILPNIFVKYAGPDVVVQLEGQKEDTIKKFEDKVKKRPEEGMWLFSGAKTASVSSVSIDPRARFEYYIEHMVNQFYLGCETPLPRLFSTPGFTEASAKAALELQDILVDPIQLEIKRLVEMKIFDPVVKKRYDPVKAAVRLNWGAPETPEVIAADLIHAAELDLIRPEEFRKNAVKILGWELWQETQQQSNASQGAQK